VQISAHWHLSIAEHARLEPILSFDDDYLANPAGALMNIASFEIAAGTPDNARDPILQAEALIKEMRPAPRKANREFHLFSLKAQLCEHDGDYPQAAVFYRLSAVRAGEYSGILAQIPALARHQAVCDRLGEPNATRGLTVALIGVDFELPDTIGLSSSVALARRSFLSELSMSTRECRAVLMRYCIHSSRADLERLRVLSDV
jgi:hypothetical protein